MSNLEELFDSHQGMMTFEQVREQGVSYHAVRKMIAQGRLKSDERGIYHRPDIYIDELYALQYRYPKGVYALETALWLHGLSLTVPIEPVMSFPYGTNTRLIKENGVKPIILRSNVKVGIVEVATPAGQMVRVYEMERTLVECLRKVYHVDVQVIANSFKQYASNQTMDFPKLMTYGRLFRVEEKLQAYLEVLQ